MAEGNIGSALGALVSNSGDDMGLNLAARICCRLSDLPDATVRSIDSDLSFSFDARGRGAVAGVAAADVLAKRRAVALLLRVDPMGAGVAAIPYDGDVWDPLGTSAYLRAAKSGPAGRSPPQRAGPYLGSSHWAYSAAAERTLTYTAWTEAIDLVEAGLRVLNRAAGSVWCDNLCRLWFGTGDRAVAARVLNTTRTGLRGDCVGLVYAGPGVATNPLKICERGYAAAGGAGPALTLPDWGSAKPTVPGTLVQQRRFFIAADTSGPRSELHRWDLGDSEISRGGAIVHEATHLFAGTEDENVTDATRTRIGARAAGVTKGYWPMVCAAMAFEQPDRAINNADTFRVFCEDALVLRGWGH